MSSLSWNPSADFAAVTDGTEGVTLITPAGEVIAVPGALRRRLQLREQVPSGGGVVADQVTWHLPMSVVADNPGVGGQIVDGAGAWWSIHQVERATGPARWKCECQRVQVAEHFAQQLVLQRPRWRKGTHGAAQAVWVTRQSSLAARLQPAEVRLVIERQRRRLRQTYRVYFPQPMSFAADDRLSEPATGRRFRILSETDANRLDALLTLTVVLDWEELGS